MCLTARANENRLRDLTYFPPIASKGETIHDAARRPDFWGNSLESQRMVMLQAIFRGYVTHLDDDASKADRSGHVALAFSVSPNGQVTHSKIISASFLDQHFNSAIEELVKQTEFGPKDVVATDVKNFDISFGPW